MSESVIDTKESVHLHGLHRTYTLIICPSPFAGMLVGKRRLTIDDANNAF